MQPAKITARPDVVIESLRGLYALAPDLAAPEARAMLHGPAPRVRELALHALGTVPDDGAVAVLADELAGASLAAERLEVIEALGLSLRPTARALLLDLVRDDRTSDALAAIEALAIHRYDPRLAADVRAAAAHSRELLARCAALFDAP